MSADTREILYEVVDGAAVVTLNRPDALNAFTPHMFVEFVGALDRAEADDDVNAVIVTGAGRAFCAGADLSGGGDTFDLTEASQDGGDQGAGLGMVGDEPWRVPADLGGALVLRIARATKPVIAAINGSAVGVGLTMTLAMDLRYVADGAKLGFPFVRRGISPDGCATWYLPRLVGMAKAQEWVLTGRLFGADEALATGLVNGVGSARPEDGDTVMDLATAVVARSLPTPPPYPSRSHDRCCGRGSSTTIRERLTSVSHGRCGVVDAPPMHERGSLPSSNGDRPRSRSATAGPRN